MDSSHYLPYAGPAFIRMYTAHGQQTYGPTLPELDVYNFGGSRSPTCNTIHGTVTDENIPTLSRTLQMDAAPGNTTQSASNRAVTEASLSPPPLYGASAPFPVVSDTSYGTSSNLEINYSSYQLGHVGDVYYDYTMSSKNPTHDGNTSHFAIASGGSGTMAPMGESSHDYSTSSHMGYDNHHTFENAPYAQDWQVYHALSRMNDAGQLPSLPISFLDFTELRGHGLSLMDPYPILSANFGFHSTDNVAERTFRDTQESNGYLLLWGADTTPDESLSGSPFETEHAQCDANQKQGIKGTGAASTPCDSEALCGHSTHHEEDAPTAVPDWDACSTVDTTSSTSYTGPESAPVILNNLQSSRTVADGRWLPREAGEVTVRPACIPCHKRHYRCDIHVSGTCTRCAKRRIECVPSGANPVNKSTRACEPCRRRRAKCNNRVSVDGRMSKCERCIRLGDRCVYKSR